LLREHALKTITACPSNTTDQTVGLLEMLLQFSWLLFFAKPQSPQPGQRVRLFHGLLSECL